MARQNYLFTSESVSEGHPDKVCDRISDEIVDLVYKEARKSGMDPWKVRVACETLATTNRLVIAGEVRVPASLCKTGKDGKVLTNDRGEAVINPAKFKSVARKAIRDIGYEQDGFNWKTARIEVLLHAQSARHRRRCRQCVGPAGRGRRGRPGHHVRLCLRRDARPDAGAALLRAQDSGTARDRPQEGRGRCRQAGPGRQEPGHGAL